VIFVSARLRAIMTFVKFLYPLLLILLMLFAIAPLEYPGAFQSHSGLLAYYNLIDLDQNPTQFFAWAPLVGRTFDLFRTEGALPYLLAEIFHLLGLSYLHAIKLVYALAWLASGLAMYALARRWLSENGALLAAIVYVYLPYHIATVYVRGAFAEAVTWALFPLVLMTADCRQQSADHKPQAFVLRLLPLTFLFLTQPGLAILFALVTFGIVMALTVHPNLSLRAVFAKQSPTLPTKDRSAEIASSQKTLLAMTPERLLVLQRHIGALASWLIGSLLLGALLYLPAVLRYGAAIARDGFQPNYVFPFQLFAALWGLGESTGSFLDQFPFQLGVVPLGLAIIAIGLAWRATDEPRDLRRSVAIFFGVIIALTMLTFEIAAPLWYVLGVFVTYPWQLLAFVSLALAIVAGAAIEFEPRLTRPPMLAFFVALPIVASYGYLAPRFLDANPTRPPIATFGNNEIVLLDYRIVGPLRHGATVRLHLTWQALRQVNHDYTVFVHAVHEDGKVYAQEDSKPQDGASPTIHWKPGQVISDTHTIQIDVEGPREGYHIEFGLYVAATGRRAPTDVGLDFVRVPRPGDPEPFVPTR
jgi:hypothetical protein